MKLDIGSGVYSVNDFGLEGFTTVDITGDPDVQADMRALPFADCSIEEIWCSHALEHVSFRDTQTVLAEFWRVLRPNGRLTLTTPDLDHVATRWLLQPDEWSLKIMFGQQENGEPSQHRAGWNARTLEDELSRAGFLVETLSEIESHSQQSLRAVCIRTPSKLDYKPNQFQGDENTDKVLVACPTYQGLSASLDEYLASYNALLWPNRGLYVVDNTRDGGAYAASLVPRFNGPRMAIRHVEPSETFEETFYDCWRSIVSHAESNGYQYILSLEQDVILPPLGLDALLNVAGYCQSPFVTHMYPFHHGRAGLYEGLGCVLMATRLVKTALETVYKDVPYVEAALYECARRVNRVTLRDLLDVKHLDYGEEKVWQFPTATSQLAGMDVPSGTVEVTIEHE